MNGEWNVHGQVATSKGLEFRAIRESLRQTIIRSKRRTVLISRWDAKSNLSRPNVSVHATHAATPRIQHRAARRPTSLKRVSPTHDTLLAAQFAVQAPQAEGVGGPATLPWELARCSLELQPDRQSLVATPRKRSHKREIARPSSVDPGVRTKWQRKIPTSQRARTSLALLETSQNLTDAQAAAWRNLEQPCVT